MKTTILDLNVLRKEPVVRVCLTRFKTHGEPVAFPELALYELSKDKDTFETAVKQSLAFIAACPEAIVLTRAVTVLGQLEEKVGEPTVTVVDEDRTEAFRTILRDIRAGGGAASANLMSALDWYRGEFPPDKHAADSLLTFQNLKAMVDAFPPEERVRLSTSLRGDRVAFREEMRNRLQLGALRDAAVRRGVPKAHADALVAEPSLSCFYALAIGSLALEWVFHGGVENARAERAGNDVLDLDYILASLWTGRLVSNDKNVRRRCEDMKSIGVAGWPGFADWFRRVEVLDGEEAVAHLT